MESIEVINHMLAYGAWANGAMVEAVRPLVARWEEPLEIGPGSLHKIIQHTLIGEEIWLQRWQGNGEVPWQGQVETTVEGFRARFETIAAARSSFVKSLTATDLVRVQPYRDSKGIMFQAPVADMLLQGVLHSHHHRAQAANAIRRLGGATLELDYMYHVRMPV